MMVGLFRHQRDLRHEAERLDEIGEDEAAGDRVARLVIIPFRQAIERIGTFGFAKGLDHRRSSLLDGKGTRYGDMHERARC